MMRKINRKTFIQTTGLATASMLMTQPFNYPANSRRITAIAFDAFAIFDHRPILKSVEVSFPIMPNKSLKFGNPGNLLINGYDSWVAGTKLLGRYKRRA